MRRTANFSISLLLILVFLTSALPCGPGYISPLFDTGSAPENPYQNYAAGRLGIVKPEFHRSVLFAAYRYIAGSGLNSAEQQGLIEAWKAEIDNKDFADNSVGDAVKAWVAKRKDILGKEEKTPEIYAERSYGGYEFFPNCTKNAFEIAAETLADRASAHGPNDPSVVDWVTAQDQVFMNCSAGKKTPADAPPGAPIWLQKDRAYQKAAAEFYSLDYSSAKTHFAEISADSESPWAEVAGYLVGRTLVRQASLSKSAEKADALYGEAEQQLQRYATGNGKFAPSAERMLNLIRYRLHPNERVGELARILSGFGNNDNFRQNVIDYNWLLDKFETEALAAEAKRKAEAERVKGTTEDEIIRRNIIDATAQITDANIEVTVANGEVTLTGNVPKESLARILQAAAEAKPKKINNQLTAVGTTAEEEREGFLKIVFYSADYTTSWNIFVKADAADDEVIAEGQRVVGKPFDDEMKKRLLVQRQSAYAEQYRTNKRPDYEGSYRGEDRLTPALLPDFLVRDELTEWLFVYQMMPIDAYPYAFDRFRNAGGDLWLMTALVKANKASPGVTQLLAAAKNASRTSPAFVTIAYHSARLLADQGRSADARKLIDDVLAMGDDLPISAQNSFLNIKLRYATTMDEFIHFSLRRPFAFDFDGDTGTIEEFIAQQKSYYDPETYTDQTREAYYAEVEERFKNEKEWQGRLTFDSDVIDLFNRHLSTAKMLEVEQSPALPEYLRDRFSMAVWTRAFLLNDTVTLNKATSEMVKHHPEFAEQMATVASARTPAAREAALLYFVLRNPILSPYIVDGMGKEDNTQEQWDSDDWWCGPYEDDGKIFDNSGNEIAPLPRPAFVTPAQDALARAERKRLSDIGDAPKYLADRVMQWAARSPMDKRIPEALYIVIDANGWTKYGCGNNSELRDEMAAYLKRKYPTSEWTRKLEADEKAQ